MPIHNELPDTSDFRLLSIAELSNALHKKFSDNFHASQLVIREAKEAEIKSRQLSSYASYLKRISGDLPHQNLLANYMDEIFGDSVCALYLASIGLIVPARMLMRRSLELGLVVVAYWDSPANFWQWQDHDNDICFSTIVTWLSSTGYITFLNKLTRPFPADAKSIFGKLPALYRDLSNVVHPKPYNFATGGDNQRYDFDRVTFSETINLLDKLQSSLLEIVSARFPEIQNELTEN
jgi:hypothetical protein